jgi:hypothetical protein
MTGKVLLIVLVLIVVLFVVLAVWGSGTNRKPVSATTFAPDAYPALGTLGDLFGSPGPKLKASELTPDPPPLKRGHGSANAAGKFMLSAGDQPTKFAVSPDNKDKIRQAAFTLTRQGCATIDYSTADGSGGKLKDQSWSSKENPKHPTQANLQILGAKGRLVFTFQSSDCTVQLE